MLELERHVLSGALLRFVQNEDYHFVDHYYYLIKEQQSIRLYISVLGPFPTWTRGYHWSRFYDQNSGNQRGEGQGTSRSNLFFLFFFINGDAFIVFGNGLVGQLLISNMMFSSCRYGTQLARRDFAPLLRVITVVPMPSFLRMTLPVRTPSGAFQSG